MTNSFLDNSFAKQIFFLFQFLPLGVKCYTATLVNDFFRIYFIGDSQKKEFFYLDLSKPFDVSNAPWNTIEIRGNVNLTRYDFATAVFNHYDNSIYYIGGETAQSGDPFIYAFNILNESFSIPNTLNNKLVPQQRVGFQAEIYNGKIYLFIGPSDNSNNFGRMILLDTVSPGLIWALGENDNPPFARYGYTATLIPYNGLIIYIGGIYQNGSYADMNEV